MMSLVVCATHEYFLRPIDGGVGFAGAAVGLLGLAILIAGRISLGRSFTIFVTPKNELKIHGIYRFTRNPIYLGVLTLAFGVSLAFQSALCTVLSLALGIVLNLKIRLEETELLKKFGASYETYLAQSSRWLKLR